MSPLDPIDLDFAREVIRSESDAVAGLLSRIGPEFGQACEAVIRCSGRVVVTGMGKAGLVGQKISATLASTGTPSLWMHAAEARHGDLGRVVADDVILALSNSGETDELLALLPAIKKIGSPLISITASRDSTLGKHSDIVLELGRIDEACPLKLAPSASSTAMLAMGDALALTVQKAHNFDAEQYARFHPGGALGRQLMQVHEVMRTGERNPIVHEGETVKEVLLAITKARAGAALIVDGEGRLTGIFTDGDLRRQIEREPNVTVEVIQNVMTRDPAVIRSDHLAGEAMKLLKSKRANQIPVVDGDRRPIGIIDVQDLLDVGIV